MGCQQNFFLVRTPLASVMSGSPLLPTEYNSLIVVQFLKNEGAKTKLILESNQVTMSEHVPHYDCIREAADK